MPFKVDLLVIKQNPASENAILYPKKENLILRIGIIRNLFLILNVIQGPGRQHKQEEEGRGVPLPASFRALVGFDLKWALLCALATRVGTF